MNFIKIIMHVNGIRKLVWAAAVCFHLPVSVYSAPPKPNIVFILTDDQGYGDLGCHGNPWLKTPHLDQLHSESVRFTDFHAGTTCAPSRAGLLTGQYPNKLGAWHTIKGRQIPDAGAKTIAQALSEEGYRTGIFGKWHLGDNYPFRPQDRGFEEVLIHKGGGVGQAPDYWENDYFDDTYFRNGNPQKFRGYCTDVWFDEATAFIEQHAEQPFFCYIALNAPHSPYWVDPRYSRAYTEDPQIPNPHFYGMIAHIDERIGFLREKLKELGLERNTILIFMTDNGTAAGVRFGKDGKVEKGFNAGMRGTKGAVYEGGHRVPFFLHWPGGSFPHGRDIHTPAASIDVMPTILDLCGISAAASGETDGRSLAPLLRGSAEWAPRYLVVDTQREELLVKDKDACVISGQWRLIRSAGKTELYHIKADPSQANEIAAAHPQVVSDLMRAYESWWTAQIAGQKPYNRIIAGSSFERETALSSHDNHSPGRNPAWNQQQVREGIYEDKGFWALEVVRDGLYALELRRWPRESGLRLSEAAPATRANPGLGSYEEGNILDYTEAFIRIGSLTYTKKVAAGTASVKFHVSLQKGPLDLEAGFTDRQGKRNNAYYVYIMEAPATGNPAADRPSTP